MKKSLSVLALICSVHLLNACGGGSKSTTTVAATHLSVTASASATAGMAFKLTVSAFDASNNIVSAYTGTVHFTSTDAQAVLPVDSMLAGGIGTFTVTLKTGGSQTVTVIDTAGSLTAGTSGSINVSPGATTQLAITACPITANIGITFHCTVTAMDAANNVTPAYTGTVHFSSTDAQGALPTNSTLTSGTSSVSVALRTPGIQSITATDAAVSSITGTSSSINVVLPPATHFSVTAPATATVGTAFNFTVTALDASNNTATGYTGTAHFTSTDGQADLPANSGLINGTATFPAAMKTTGSQTITATDLVNNAITGISSSINVGAAAAANPLPLIYQPLSPDAVAIGGAGFTGTLTVNGTGFVSGAVVHWNGIARATKFVNQSKLTATVLAADTANANTASVTVVNPAPGGGTSNVLFFETTRATSSVALRVPSNFTIGSAAGSIANGDFNGDGRLDLAVADSGIHVLLGNGDGTFQPAVDYGPGSNSDFVAVGDFNGDGKLDLVATNSGVSVLMGNGDGTFQPAVNYNAGSGPYSIAVGDFNSDGKLDLAVANVQSGNVSVFLGNGDGTFEAAVSFSTAAYPYSVAVGDFNDDGRLDLVTANFGDTNVSVLLGNGDGTFQPAINYGAGPAPSAIAVGDFNGDGSLDLAVTNLPPANTGSSSVAILLGNGDGTFQSAVNYAAASSIYTSSVAVALGDFNGDGKLDLAVANLTIDLTNNVSILLGNGDGTFQSAANYGVGSKWPVAVGDFNGNGRLDLAVGGAVTSTVSLLLQPPLVSGANAFLSTDSLTFATQLVGTTSAAQTVLLSNYGTAPLSISSIATNSNFAEKNDCGSNLASGASCTIDATFSPTARDSLTGTLSVADDAPGNPHTISLNGTGTVVLLNPTSLNFGCIPEPIGHCTCFTSGMTTLTNTGTAPLNISSITVTGSSLTNNCPTSLGAGQSCNISVHFTSDGAITITDDGGASPQTVPLNSVPSACHR